MNETLGRFSANRGSARPSAFAASLVLALVYAWACSGKLAWAAIIPSGSVIFWSNLGLAGWRRPMTTIALLVIAVAYTITPVARPILAPVELAETSQWCGDICLQSDSSSCAPAAAVTLLRFEGIEADERSLAAACLTSRHGTEPLGLFSGLAAATHCSGVYPQVASPDPSLWADDDQLPAIALVRFADSREHGSLRRLLGPRGEGHAVVVLGRDSRGNWTIADPAFGKTTWSDVDFRRRFTGDAINLASEK